jgi:hypothetical protein
MNIVSAREHRGRTVADWLLFLPQSWYGVGDFQVLTDAADWPPGGTPASTLIEID